MSRPSIIYGEATRDNGTAVPVVVEQMPLSRLRVDLAPDRLDTVIRTLIDNAESSAMLLKRYAPLLDGLMRELHTKLREEMMGLYAPDGSIEPVELKVVLNLAGQVALIMERLSKINANTVKAKDEAVRLQMDLSGQQGRGDMDNMSENELRRLVTDAASGWQKPDAGP